MANLIKGNKCFEEGASNEEVKEMQNKLNKTVNCADGHSIEIGWSDTDLVPYAKIDKHTMNAFLVSSDNNSIKLNWTGAQIAVIVNGITIGYMSIDE